MVREFETVVIVKVSPFTLCCSVFSSVAQRLYLADLPQRTARLKRRREEQRMGRVAMGGECVIGLHIITDNHQLICQQVI